MSMGLIFLASDSPMHVRVRSTFGYRWLWELRSADGHVVNTSAEFSSRDDCVRDAERQGVAVKGGRRPKKPQGG
jgi:hypothetical protein